MSEFKGTPGPWVIGRSGHGRPYQIETAGGLCITKWGGISRPASAEGESNAHLISAAPELLEALDIIVKLDENKVYMDDPWQDALKIARAAIAKATGEE